MQFSSRYRMPEQQLRGVKEHGRHLPLFLKEFVLFIAAMLPVANDRVKYVGKMPAQLVHTACGGCRFNQ